MFVLFYGLFIHFKSNRISCVNHISSTSSSSSPSSSSSSYNIYLAHKSIHLNHIYHPSPSPRCPIFHAFTMKALHRLHPWRWAPWAGLLYHRGGKNEDFTYLEPQMGPPVLIGILAFFLRG